MTKCVCLFAFSLCFLNACQYNQANVRDQQNSFLSTSLREVPDFPGLKRTFDAFPEYRDSILNYDDGNTVPTFIFSDSLDAFFGAVSMHGPVNCVRLYIIDSMASKSLLQAIVRQAPSFRRPELSAFKSHGFIQEPCLLSVEQLAVLRLQNW